MVVRVHSSREHGSFRREYRASTAPNFRENGGKLEGERGYRGELSESQMAAEDPLAQFRPVRFIPLHRCTLLHLA